ncbi:MAG: hypothetical protein KGL39_56110 [Patescibacteria group bacterium]|nr:hypothetical protein [Patescibacteria group bacterium]
MPTSAQAQAASVSRRTISAADRALPCCELFGFHGLIIAGDFVTAKVTTSGDGGTHTHGIRASRKMWREFAQRILAADEAAQKVESDAARAAAGAPLRKPGGGL